MAAFDTASTHLSREIEWQRRSAPISHQAQNVKICQTIERWQAPVRTGCWGWFAVRWLWGWLKKQGPAAIIYGLLSGLDHLGVLEWLMGPVNREVFWSIWSAATLGYYGGEWWISFANRLEGKGATGKEKEAGSEGEGPGEMEAGDPDAPQFEAS
jgi:hypothetical protein